MSNKENPQEQFQPTKESILDVEKDQIEKDLAKITEIYLSLATEQEKEKKSQALEELAEFSKNASEDERRYLNFEQLIEGLYVRDQADSGFIFAKENDLKSDFYGSETPAVPESAELELAIEKLRDVSNRISEKARREIDSLFYSAYPEYGVVRRMGQEERKWEEYLDQEWEKYRSSKN